MELTEKYITRFWQYVDKRGSCWIWCGRKDRDGYGQFTTYINKKYKQYKAHRISYFLSNGILDDKLLVCHSCDNPSCVNPLHLFQGSVKDNSYDMVSKNRQAKGSKGGNSVLNEQQVLEIKKLIYLGIKQVEIAKMFAVTQVTISCIKTGKTWRHHG